MSERFDNAVNELSLAWRRGAPQEEIAAARVALEVAHWDDAERHAASERSLREKAERRLDEAHAGWQRCAADLASETARANESEVRAETLTKERDEARSWHLAARERYAAAESDAARLRAGMLDLAAEWESEARRRERDSDAEGPHGRRGLRLGASFERAHAERLRALSASPSTDAAKEPAP